MRRLLLLAALACSGTLSVLTLPPSSADAACRETTSSSTNRRGSTEIVSTDYRATCSGEEVTGLGAEELWATYCNDPFFGEYEEGDKVIFRFEALSPSEVVTLADVQAAANERETSLVGSFDTPDLDIPLLPTRAVDLTEVYVNVYVTCDQVDTTVGDLTFVFIEAVSTYVDPIALRNQAEAALTLDDPAVGTNPAFDQPDRFGAVRIPTWLWIDDPWETAGPSIASDGPAQVAVAAIPNFVAWDMGDGEDPVYCLDAGTPWERGLGEDGTDCKHTYTKSSAGVGANNAFDVSATMNWTLVWWVNGTYLGAYDSTERTTDFTYPVGEIQAVGS